MFTNFIQNLYPIFIEEDFELLSEGEEFDIFSDENEMIRFAKRENTMLYIVNIWNMEKVDLDTFIFRKNAFKKKLEQVFEELHCSYLIVLNLLVTDEEIPFIKPEEFQPNKEIYTISWIIDLQYKKLIIPKKEIDDVLNIRELIHKVFRIIDPSLEKEADDLITRKDERKKRYFLRQRTNNTFLTYVFIILNVIIWLLMELNGGSEDINTLLLFGANEPFLVIERQQYWRLITSTFLHIGISHLLYNTFALYIFGSRIEKYYGKVAFLIIYFISGMIGSMASLIFSDTVSAGASGAIYGLMGALLMIAYKTKKEVDGLNAFTILIMIMLGVAFGFLMPFIDNPAHIGGLIAGMISGRLILQKINKKNY